MEDSFGDRMKEFEQAEAGRKAMALLPICIRLDGKGFSRYTKDLARPYDQRMSDIMMDVTRFLVEEINACIGYTQSDEISLVLYSPNYDSQVFFDGKIQKLVSVLASMCSVHFNELARQRLPNLRDRPSAYFDCRAWTVPNKTEAANTLLWRELDATKNSISMAARHYCSHNELQNKNGYEMQEMIYLRAGINWNDYPSFFKRGTFLQRRSANRILTTEELEKIPEKYRPTEPVLRNDIVKLENMPPFSRVSNREDVVFSGADPLVYAKQENET